MEEDKSKKSTDYSSEKKDEVAEMPPPKCVQKRVSIQSEFKVKRASSFQLKQQNFSTPQLINSKDIQNNNQYLKVNENETNTSELNAMVPEQLITELSSIALELMNNNKPPEVKKPKDLLIYTKAMEIPSKLEMLVESRVVLRICQLVFAIGAFASLSVSSLDANFKSNLIAESGINIMCLVSISSIMVAFATLFVYFNPRILGVTPQRHFRSSRVEVCVDFFYLAIWIFASSELAIFGRCPQQFFDFHASSEKSCYSWNFCMGFGFAEAVLYLFTFVRGIYDLKTHDWGRRTMQKYNGKGVHLWVRGNWIDDMNQEEK